ncbi:histone acetyltransferase complex component Epl1 [Xylariaceae sp. FL0255]|nr:histone acetyltransferase complex component Epl1 [Xylariaceae sp. FL0255]
MTTRKVRYKKLNIKTPLPVLREHQIDASEYESLTTESQIATGVEQGEENEYHLQAALRAVGAAANVNNEIPVPPPQKSVEANYDELYPTTYVEPRNYIKSSDTVEEAINGCPYDMTAEDDEFLKTYNAKKPASTHLSEDDFEHIMFAFEETAHESAPFGDVDNTTVAYEVMACKIPDNKLFSAHGKGIYEHWRSRRQSSCNKPLRPSLKFETHQEHDDMDPYVCFRRREVRQTRKTRARDVQIADKLKKLRKELEDARHLVVLSHARETNKREMLKIDKMIYEQRAKLKETKVKLGIKSDDDDLVNTKPQKRPKPEPQQPPRAVTNQVRQGVRPDGHRTMEPMELTLLRDKHAERQAEFRNNIELKVQEHRRWNTNYVDLTAEPLPPVREEKEVGFRPAKTTYLMTPPASSDSMEIDEPPPAPEKTVAPFVFKGVPLEDSDQEFMPSFRRRVGRLNRLFIDRRPGRSQTGLSSPPREPSSLNSDRWKYDHDDDDDETPVHHIDTNNLRQMKFRSTIPPPPMLYRRQGMSVDPAQMQAGGARPGLTQSQAQSLAQMQVNQAQAAAQLQAAQVHNQAQGQSVATQSSPGQAIQPAAAVRPPN